MTIEDIMRRAPVIPVLTIARVDHAVPLARALVAGGLPVLEVTLRTDAALDAVAAIRREVPDAIVGLGTMTTAADFEAARKVGAAFGVSPGLTPALAEAANASGLPFLPGIATASEAMRALEFGFSRLKFFPAEAAGGRAMLSSLAGPFADLRFCPTGGIREETAADWLKLPNVLCVGGSWLAGAADLEAGAWEEIEARACRAAVL
ncbi:bifunctional 4-hydroxy-2-oxoglutarate aldolase/2-dehydro-3-deoxy-phosphogluconate aldolase [Inquilinus sp. CAU 1745]|uniref:bifunctional 4-hydroxy-2-oxoglutarate aldolase/2-dehydro-3-deoxy-phosphogluconate aldolase n=1 Tax=Inquilinus sp. CAU 1745 TaxID=3140369 RepID=UPI00325BC059